MSGERPPTQYAPGRHSVGEPPTSNDVRPASLNTQPLPGPAAWVSPTHLNGQRHPHQPLRPPPYDENDLRAIHRRVSTDLASRLTDGETVTPDGRRQLGTKIAAHHVKTWVDAQAEQGHRLTNDEEQRLLDAVLARLFGLGRLQTLIDDPDVENVMVLGCDHVRVEYADGVTQRAEPAAESDEELIEMLQRAGAENGQGERVMTQAKPRLHLRLPNGSRLAALAFVTPRPVVVIRRHRTRDVDIDAMVNLGVLTPPMADFLRTAMAARLNIMVAGLQMAGKTTLLRALASEIPSTEWFATMENEIELHLHETGRHPWVVPVEAREGHGDRGADGRMTGEVSIGDLIPDMLRMSMSRVIVGEVRSSEIVPMLRAMGTSRGSLCTIHARTAGNVFERIVELALEHGSHVTEALAYRLTANALDYIVYVEMTETPLGHGAVRRHRRVSHIIEVDSIGEGGRPATNTIFGPMGSGEIVAQVAPGRTGVALRMAGLDPARLLQHRTGSWGELDQAAFR